MVWTTAILTLVQPRAQMHFSFLAVQLCRALVPPLGGKWDLCAAARNTIVFNPPLFPTGSLALGGIMVNFYLGSISRKNGNSNENCSKIFKRIFLAYRSPTSISGPGPQRKDRRHGDHTDGLHGGGVLRVGGG